MKLDKFEEMLNSAIGYLDNYITARAIRDLGYNLHFYNETLGHNNVDDQPVKWKGLVGLEDTKIYLTVFDGTVNPNITRADLLRLYKPFLKELHKIAINTRYGLNCYVPEAVSDAVMDTDCLKPGRYPWVPSKNQLGLKGGMTYIDESFKNNIIMEDTYMIYTLMNRPNHRGGTNYLMTVEPKKIHFNGPATIVEWNDGTKTVVKCQKGDTFDPMTGVAMCCMKKMLGTNASGSNYLNDVSKLIDEAWEAKNKRYEKKEKALKQKKETNDVSDPDWNVIAEKLDRDFRDKAIDMLLNAIDNTPDNFDSEDKHD